MADATQISRMRTRHLARQLANVRAFAGAGVGEDEVLAAMNRRHIGVLEQQLAAGALDLHLGLALHGKGVPFCVGWSHHTKGTPLLEAREGLGAFRSPYFSMKLPERQRWWCGIMWLELNRGCPTCISLAYQFADEEGWPQPKRLGDLLELPGGDGALGPQRGVEQTGPRMTRQGFTRG